MEQHADYTHTRKERGRGREEEGINGLANLYYEGGGEGG